MPATVTEGRLSGLLYLENRMTSHVFTAERTTLLDLVASQAAISLENARLYRDLQEREAKVRRLVDANIIGIFIWDLDGQIIDANDAFLRIVGYGRDDFVSQTVRWTELTQPNGRPRCETSGRGSGEFERQYRAVQMELAHANRLATWGN